MLKQIIKCLPVLLAALLMGGCGELSTPELAGRLASVIGTADAAEALEVLGLPVDEKADGASSYTLSACPELVPEGIEADESHLQFESFFEDEIASVGFIVRCENMSLSDAYQTMQSISDSLYEEYTTSALDEIYIFWGSFGPREVVPFIEMYPTEADFRVAYENMSGDTFPELEVGDCWWTDETKTDYVAVRFRYTEEDTYFYWIAQNNAAYNEYGARLGPLI